MHYDYNNLRLCFGNAIFDKITFTAVIFSYDNKQFFLCFLVIKYPICDFFVYFFVVIIELNTPRNDNTQE